MVNILVKRMAAGPYKDGLEVHVHEILDAPTVLESGRRFRVANDGMLWRAVCTRVVVIQRELGRYPGIRRMQHNAWGFASSHAAEKCQV